MADPLTEARAALLYALADFGLNAEEFGHVGGAGVGKDRLDWRPDVPAIMAAADAYALAIVAEAEQAALEALNRTEDDEGLPLTERIIFDRLRARIEAAR